MKAHPSLHNSLLDSAPDALLFVDDSGAIVQANTQAVSLFGYPRDELITLSVDALLPERFRQRHISHRQDYSRAPTTREMGARMVELLALRSDGSEVPVEIHLSSLELDGERLIAVAIRDVTQRRLEAAELRAARAEADRANRLKGRFLATASHDLRQPLQTLQLLNGALMRQVTDRVGQDLLRDQSEVLNNMAGLLNTLLDVSKLEGGDIKPRLEDVSVEELFQSLRLEFDSIALAQGLTLTVTPAQLLIHTDRILFRQVLENLLSNALKYTKTGTVVLQCEMRESAFAIEVADTGIGIAQDQLASIFDEFYQVQRQSRKPGVGLGLAIVKRIVGMLGFSLAVTSKLGTGSQFQILIPRRLVSQATTLPKESADRPPPPRDLRGTVVLLVEDDEAVLRATALYLKAIGFVTLTARSIADAHQALRDSKLLPDIVISDYHLGPSETGADLIASVRTQFGRALPALLLSGDTSSAIHELSATGSYRLLSKPVDAELLSDTITQLLSESSH